MYSHAPICRKALLPALVPLSAVLALMMVATTATANGIQQPANHGRVNNQSLAAESIDTQIFPAEDESMADNDEVMKSEHEDSLRPFNQIMFSFNITLDKYLLRPIAHAWVQFTPNVLRQTVDNFFSNLELPHTIVNQVLQARFDDAGHNTARFIFNSTIGLAGTIDVGDAMLNLPQGKDADLGQTLAFWGVPQGPYIMLPVFGPQTLRGIPNLAMAAVFDPLNYELASTGIRIGAAVVEGVNTRSYFIGPDKILYESINPYVLSRNLYLKTRANFADEAMATTDGYNNTETTDDDDFFDSIEQNQP